MLQVGRLVANYFLMGEEAKRWEGWTQRLEGWLWVNQRFQNVGDIKTTQLLCQVLLKRIKKKVVVRINREIEKY